MRTLFVFAQVLLVGLVAVLPLQAAAQYEELAKKLISHIPQQGSPVRMAVVKFTLPEDKKGLGGAEYVKDELEVELGRDSRIKLITRTDLEALEKEWSFQEGEMADPQTQTQQSKVAGIDVLVRGRVVVQDSGEICIFAELLNVADGAISKERVSWMPATAQSAAPALQPVNQPAPQPAYQPQAVQPAGSVWDSAIDDLAAQTYSDAYLKLLQKRLLSALRNIRSGGDVNAVIPNANGTTALHNACGLGNYEVVKLLLEHGADVTRKTAKGASVRTCVGNDSGNKIDKLLRSYGAR
ncbi:MAG: ankyrin repeat domain-containing protein [Akkermansia sp.]|nr:ankyrin repeat domain-containing protein [Akkermansia sp.]